MATSEERFERGMAIRQQLWGTPPTLPAIDQPFADLRRLIFEFAFGDVWSRPGLDIKTRSFCTMSALIALGRTEELRAHMRGALNLGITRGQLEELVTHMAVYSGFPAAVTAMRVANEVFAEREAASS